MGWNGLDIAVCHYANLAEKPVVYVVLPTYIIDKQDGVKRYLDKWSKFVTADGARRVTIVTTPGIEGEPSLDDLYTLLCAKENDCQFVDNDNYRDWRTRVTKDEDPYYDPNLAKWLQENRARLHVNYSWMGEKFLPGKPFRFGRKSSR